MIAKGFASTLLRKLLLRLRMAALGLLLILAAIAANTAKNPSAADAAVLSIAQPTQAAATHTYTHTPTQTPSNTPTRTSTPSMTSSPTLTSTASRTPTRTPIPPSATPVPTLTIDYIPVTRTALAISINALSTQAAMDIERKQREAETIDHLRYFAGLACIAPIGLLLFGLVVWVLYQLDWQRIGAENTSLTTDAGDNDLVRVEITEGSSTRLHKYEVPRPILRAWADAVLSGRPLGINHWTGAGRYFERDTSHPERDYKLFLDFWFKNGLIRRVNPDVANSRIKPTEQGRVILEKIVRGDYLPSFPLPTGEEDA